MKTNYKYIISALMLLLPACQREIAELEELVSGETVEITVSMDPETKATLSEEDGAMCFSSGDAIKIFDGTAVYSGVTSSTSSDGLFAMASGFNRAGTGYAGFPAGLVSTITSDGVTFALPSTYEYAQVGGINADEARVLCPMVGTYAGGQIILKQAGAVIRFYVTDIVAGSLTFTFPTDVTGTTAAIPTPTGDSDGILASGLTDAGRSITVTGVPAVPNGTNICITLPVPTGTVPQNIKVINAPADGSMPRFASAVGSSESLSRADGYRIMYDSFHEPEAVDLGLSVKWANMNVGAASETDYGDYFAWGETTTKSNYAWSTYKWGTSKSNLTKYNSSDGKTVLDLSDDAAHVNWGDNWRMPTYEELYELLATNTNTTDYEWVWYDGSTNKYNNSSVAGFSIMSKKSATYGNHIFFPAAGYRGGTSLYIGGPYGYYWSSSLYSDDPNYAWDVLFYPGNAHRYDDYRYYAYSVRPVYQGEAPAITLASVEISPESVTLWAGETQQLTATAKDASGNTISGANIYWTVESGFSATVNSSGLVTASPHTSGTTTIRATAAYNGVTKTADCTVMVIAAEAVDLGLSVKWANMNVGALTETDYGDFFAWGEIEPYYSSLSPLAWKEGKSSGYAWASYQWGDGSSFSKYTGSDDKPVLDLSDDAAHVNWGGTRRMPTKAEFDELLALPSEWISNYNNTGVAGYKFTATNGNSIFLPAAGNMADTYQNVGVYNGGYYWSSSLRTDKPDYASLLYFRSGGAYCINGGRFFGYPVRPVIQGDAPAITLASVEISPEAVTLWTGETQQLTATAKDASGNTISDAAITWSVVSGTSATVNASTGLVTASATEAGETVIRATATYGGVTQTADCTVTVKKLSSVTLSSTSNFSVNVGSTSSALTATAKDNTGATISGVTVTWNSSNTSVATISNGVVHGVAPGTSLISATVTYKSVTVTSSTLTVTVTPIMAVDLGIEVDGKRILWANMNVGAASETDYGDYFAWGETEPKDDYSWSTYKWGTSESNMTKYNSTDGKTVLDLSDDAAHVNWGGNWRMPTYAELNALSATRTKTTDYEWVWYDGSANKYNNSSHAGWLIVSKKSGTYGNHIFLPAAGIRGGAGLNVEGDYGCYWSSSLLTDIPGFAWYLDFASGGADCYNSNRYYGHSVRPVSE